MVLPNGGKHHANRIRLRSSQYRGPGRQRIGLDAQRRRIRAYSELKGLHLAEILEDSCESWAKALSTRPAGARLLALARRSKPVVVVAKFDRLFRSVAGADLLVKKSEKSENVSPFWRFFSLDI